MEGAVRSFPPFKALAMRFDFPLWHLADDVDPKLLKGRLTSGERRNADKQVEAREKILAELKEGGKTVRELRSSTGFGRDRTENALAVLAKEKLVEFEEVIRLGGKGKLYSLVKPKDNPV